jgi:WD40 repeat protein
LVDHEAPVQLLLELANGDLLSASRDGCIKIWSVERAELKQSIKSQDHDFECVELLHSGDVAFGHSSGKIHIWTLNPLMVKVKTLAEGRSPVKSLAAIGHKLLASSHLFFDTMKIWDLEKDRIFFYYLKRTIHILALPNDHLATCDHNIHNSHNAGHINIYDVNADHIVRTLSDSSGTSQ